MAYVISDDCIACGTCIDECPVGAIRLYCLRNLYRRVSGRRYL